MTVPGLVLRNVFRNPRRTFLTMISIGVSLGLVVVLTTIVAEIYRPSKESGAIPRLVVRHRTSLGQPLPTHYGAKIAQLPHVAGVTALNWFGGQYKDDRPENFFARFACDPDSFFRVFREWKPDKPEYLGALKREQTACLVGPELLRRYGWSLGDRIQIRGDIYPVDLELTIRGTFSGPDDTWLIFQNKYLDEALGFPARVGTYWVLADSLDDVPVLIDSIDTMFRNSDAETKSETEKAFQLSFIEMLGNIQLLIKGIVSVVVFAILLVAASTMAMAVRERTPEIAILKTLGFQRATILRMIVAEGILVSIGGGIIGVIGVWLLLPHPKWFVSLAGGISVLAATSMVGILGGTLLPERRAADTRYSLFTGLQHFVWQYGPWISFGLGVLTTVTMLAALPPLDWFAFSNGFIQRDLHVPTETLLLGAGITFIVGFYSSIVPAWNASRIRVVEGLRTLG